MDLIEFLQGLINCPSITPFDNGALDFVQDTLQGLGFSSTMLEFHEQGTPSVKNLYARLGSCGPNLCFAGHTDVVSVSDEKNWLYGPFQAQIAEKKVFGRGAVDMKGAIAAFMVAVSQYIQNFGLPKEGSISFLLTGDEEGPAINGTKKVLEWLAAKGEQIDACLIGEPTCYNHIGDNLKIGARGSITYYLKVYGKQGHVAYNQFADNAIDKLIKIMSSIKQYALDSGTHKFSPSTLEFTGIEARNLADNVVPGLAQVRFNIRFNDFYTKERLTEIITGLCCQHTSDFHLDYLHNSDPFITRHDLISQVLSEAALEVTGIAPSISTSGGSSDARFIQGRFEAIEFGLRTELAHQVNEHVLIEELEALQAIYYSFICKFFADKRCQALR